MGNATLSAFPHVMIVGGGTAFLQQNSWGNGPLHYTTANQALDYFRSIPTYATKNLNVIDRQYIDRRLAIAISRIRALRSIAR